MTRVAICCYSSTGNTRPACSYIAARLVGCETRLFDIGQGQAPEWDQCDLVGLACLTDYWGPSWVMREWLDPKPVFDEPRCYGCWACYNRCPKRAIYTKKLRGRGHYPGPSDELRRKLGPPTP
jgi:NAD-dependent dihydropyrimidine dehydrogenase PreA subunit